MSTEIISRAEAAKHGLKTYFTGNPCVHRHLSERSTRDGKCRRCIAISNEKSRKDPARTAYQKRYGREWYAKHKERCKTLMRTHYRQNKKKYNERMRQWHAEHRDEHTLQMRRHYAANRERLVARYRKLRHAYPQKYRLERGTYRRNRRARLRAAGKHSPADIQSIHKLQNGRCAYCKTTLKEHFHVDHIKPLAKGGGNDRTNLQLTCRSCNCQKATLDPIVFARSRGMLL
jgi:HNH endonuclease